MSELSSFKLNTSNNTEIPLKSVLYEVDVCNQICQFTMSQSYTNDEKVPIEAYYTFPKMANSSVYDFQATINDRVISTQLKPKEAAVKEYNEAIKDGHKAFLMEKVDGDTFSICIGNLPPMADVKIQIRCCLELSTEIDSTNVRLCIPMTIMPKYTPKDSPSLLSNVLSSVTRTSTKPYDMQIKGHVYMTDGIVSLESKSSNLKITNMLPNEVDFSIVPEELNVDIVLSIKRHQPKTFILTSKYDSLPEDSELLYASQVNIIPNFSQVPDCDIKDSAYIIILDSSGSMEGQDFKNCIASGILFVSSLPIGSKFNVYNFSDNFHKFNTEPVTVTSDTKQEAVKWMNKVRCGGGTEVLPVLEDVYKTLGGENGTIVFLSDGGVSNTSEVIKLVKKNKNISVYTIGIGQNVSQQLIKDMASQSVGGVSEFINSSNDELELKVLAQLNRAQQNMRKCLKKNKISVNTNGPYKLVPELTLLYEGDVNTFYVFSNQLIESVTYDQFGPDNSVCSSTTVAPATYQNDGHLIHRLGGVKLINELYASESNVKFGSQIPHLRMDVNAEASKVTKEQIVKVSQTLGVLSKYTAFIGVEKQDTPNGVVQVPLLRQVPLQNTKKMMNESCCLQASSFGGGSRSFSRSNMGARSVSAPKSASRSVAKSARYVSSSEEEDCGSVLDGFEGAAMSQKCESSISTPGLFSQLGSYINSYVSATPTPTSPVPTSKPWGKNVDDLRSGNNPSVSYDSVKKSTSDYKTWEAKPTVMANYVVKVKLPYYDVLGQILSARQNGALPFAKDIEVDDYIELTMEGGNNGIYRVMKLGSASSPWVLKRV